jgi:hypothetical protein
MVILVIKVENRKSDTEANDSLTMGIFVTIQELYLLGPAASSSM